MSWKGIFEGIESFFVDFVFWPFDWLRETGAESWAMSNLMTWAFTIIGFVAFFYWMAELKKHNTNNEEDRSSVGHSYLG